MQRVNITKDKENIDKKSKYTYNKRRVRVGIIHSPFDAKDPDGSAFVLTVIFYHLG